MCFECCYCKFFPLPKLKSGDSRESVKVTTPVIEFHPISEHEQLFAKKLGWIPPPLHYSINNNNDDSDKPNGDVIKSTSLESPSPQKKVDTENETRSSR